MGAKSNTLRLSKDSAIGVLHLVRTGPARLPKDHPFAPCDAYLESLATGGGRAQRVNMQRAVRILTGNPLASVMDFDWRTFTFRDVEIVRDFLRRKHFSSSTINGTISGFREIARRAWRLEQMSVEELERIRDVSRVHAGHRVRAVRALSFMEIKLLFEVCDRAGGAGGARDACLFTLLYGAGLRAGEAARLQLSDLQPRSHTLRVHGKGDRDRTIYFRPGGARKAIHQWLRVRGGDPGALLHPVTRHGEVIRRPLSYPAIYRALERRARLAGLDQCTPHDLRRSIGTHLEEKTHDIELVRAFLGHVDVRTTQIYLMRGEATRRKAGEKVDVPFRSGVGIRAGGKRRRRGRRKGSNWKTQLRANLS